MSDFKACPFCGCDKQVFYPKNSDNRTENRVVVCANCQVFMNADELDYVEGFKPHENVREKWNTRPLHDKAIAERDEYKQKLDKVVDLFNSLYQDTEYILDKFTGSDFEKASFNQYAKVLHDEILKTGKQ